MTASTAKPITAPSSGPSTGLFDKARQADPQAIKAAAAKVVSEANAAAPAVSSAAGLASSIKKRDVSDIPGNFVETRKSVGAYIESKMPNTDSWLYKNTGFIDNPKMQAFIKPAERTLNEAEKLAPSVTSSIKLTKDALTFQLDKVPQDISNARKSIGAYIEQKMPNTDSWLYKHTGWVDKPMVQSYVKGADKVLNEVDKIAPSIKSAGTMARDIATFQVDKVPQDITATRKAIGDYIEQKMPNTDSWLYKSTGFIDNPKMQAFIKPAEKVLNEVGNVAPTFSSAGTLVRDSLKMKVENIPKDISEANKAIGSFIQQKMPDTNSALYRYTWWVDSPAVQKITQPTSKAIDLANRYGDQIKSGGEALRKLSDLKGLF